LFEKEVPCLGIYMPPGPSPISPMVFGCVLHKNLWLNRIIQFFYQEKLKFTLKKKTWLYVKYFQCSVLPSLIAYHYLYSHLLILAETVQNSWIWDSRRPQFGIEGSLCSRPDPAQKRKFKNW